MDVSVIIVSFNTKKNLLECVNSILKNTKDVEYEIIIVDNASTDGTIEAIEEIDNDKIKLIKNEINYGFGKANNIGVNNACGKYVFLLNSDTILLNNALLLFLNKAEQNKKEMILGCYLLNEIKEITYSYSSFDSKKSILVKLAYLYIPIFFTIRRMLPLKFRNVNKQEKDVDFITGADMFMSKNSFEIIGGFDEDFFMYCEDEDLCIRAYNEGIKCHIINEPQIIHLDGGSLKGKSKEKRRIQIKSLKILLNKHYRGDKQCRE